MASHPYNSNDNDTVAADANFLEHTATPLLGELHRSNVLRLETCELLRECKLDFMTVKWHSTALQYVEHMNRALETMAPTISPTQQHDCPLPLTSDKRISSPLQIKTPLTVSLDTVTTRLGMTTKRGNANELPVIKCYITLPNELWNRKDYLHHRFFTKRNLIFWHVFQHLQQQQQQHKSKIGMVEWKFASGNPRLPVMILTPPPPVQPKKSGKIPFQVELSLLMESIDWIPPTRLFPNRHNLGSTTTTMGPTPIYNTDLIKRSVVMVSLLPGDTNDWEMHRALQEELPTSCHDALVLLKIWSLQRGFLGGHDGFTGMEDVAFLVVYLLRTKHVTSRMAPLELLAAVWKFISETKWLSSDDDNDNKSNRVALVIPRPNETESQTIAACRQAQLYATSTAESPLSATHDDPPTLLECFQQWTPGPILLNSQMTCNLWGNMSRSFCRHLQQAASKSLDCLHHHSSSHVIWPFSYLFLQEARFYSAMHAVMRIPFRMFRDDATDLGISETVVELLYEALGNRVTLIRVLTTGNGPLENIHTYCNTSEHHFTNTLTTSPSTGQEDLVLGFVLNSTTCHRLVDRGPPADNAIATQKFIQLWGPKAQLRRFKDGAIVHAVVWNHEENDEMSACSIRMQHDEKTQGAIVEQIVRHVLNLHFFQQHATLKVNPQFALRDMVSLVDGVANSTQHHEEKLVTNATAAFKSAMSAFESLSEFLRHNSSPTIPVEGSADAKTSRLGVPLAIDAVEPLSPTLRYSELFPPLPHSSLGGPRVLTGKKVSGVAPPPILIQIRFGLSSKWPTDLRAMGAAKTAMLIQLANGIESMKHAFDFDGPIHVTPSYMDVGYKGYLWRITVRADPELNMLRKLQQLSPEAVSLLRVLTRDHVVSATHHSMIHAINTAHPSSSSVVRLAKRWTAAHLLSDLIPFEAIELLVAKVYTNRDVPLDPPTTVLSGFLRFLFLLASHNWKRYPLIVDPHDHLSEDDHSNVVAQFEQARGPEFKNGPPMFIVTPSDRVGASDGDEAGKSNKMPCMWSPTFTQHDPETVVLSRAATLAKRSYDFLTNALCTNKRVDWSAVFHETASSFKSYSALLRIDSDFVDDRECSSTGSDLHLAKNDDGILQSSWTRSMRQRFLGPKALRRKVYRNLNAGDENAVMEWRPVEEMVQTIRTKFGSLALFFYNDLTPEVVCVLFRPTSFVPRSFSAMNSEYVLPIEAENWKSDSLVIHNTSDVLREMSQYTSDIVANVKILDDPTEKAQPSSFQSTRKRRADSDGEDANELSSSDSDSS